MKLIPRPRLLSYYQFQKLSRTMVRTKLQLTQIEFSDTANVKSFLNCLCFNRDLKLVSFFKLKVLASIQRVYFEQCWFELSRNSNEALLITKNVSTSTYKVQISYNQIYNTQQKIRLYCIFQLNSLLQTVLAVSKSF